MYMSAHVLLNFINEFGKRDKIQCKKGDIIFLTAFSVQIWLE